MCHITTWEEDYNGNNTSASLQSPLANSSSPSCTKLGLRRMRTCIPLHGTATTSGRAVDFVEVKCRSLYAQEQAFSIRALVLTEVTDSVPSITVLPASKWERLAQR
jgi:hypothetical protein